MKTSLLKLTFRRLSSKTTSSLTSEQVFSEESKERCIARIKKMKSFRPTNVEVKQRAAVLVPLVDIGGSPHILFTRRSLSLSSHRGQVSFPGGKEDPGDGNLTRTALRETEEELGIPSTDVDVWCQMPELSSSQKGDYSCSPVVGLIRSYSPQKLRVSQAEVSSVFTVPMSTLVNPANHGYTQFRTGPKSPGYSLPLFHQQVPHVVWGLTAIITFQMLKALLPGTVYSHKLIFQKPISEPR